MIDERFTISMSESKSIPAHALYGAPVGNYRLSAVAGAALAAASAPYIGRGNKCSANEDTCEGMRAKGTELCMGHLRSSKRVSVETKGESDGASTNDTI